MKRRIAWTLYLLLSLSLATACRGRARYVTGEVGPGGEVVTFAPPPTAMIVSPTQDVSGVEAALIRALRARGWGVEEAVPGRITARLDQRRTQLRIALDYDGSRVGIALLSSVGLELDDASRSRRYEGWMRNLASSIEEELARPAREAQEAIARAESARRDEAERERRARLESERLATERARAEADAERERRAAVEAEAPAAAPRFEGARVHVVVPGFAFDADAAMRARGALTLGARLPERSLPGVAGGPVRGDSLGLPAACAGFFPTAPQHTLVIDRDVDLVRIEAPSRGDATLALVAADGSVWCDDDGGGSLTPRLEGWLPAGVYHVFVGNYRGPDPLPYQLVFSRGGAVVGPVVVAPPDCRRTLLELGHSSTALMFCEDVEPACADALLRAGHTPDALIFCRDVDPACSVPLLQSGRGPTELVHCSR